MTQFSVFLTDFVSLRPKHETSQEKTLEWLVDAHCQSEHLKNPEVSENQRKVFRKELREKLFHVGCKPDKISKRGHSFDDFLHKDWSQMKIYRLEETSTGVMQTTRTAMYDQITSSILEKFYQDTKTPPHDLIHVSCTGYAAPSCAQRVVSKKGWGDQTHITHAYHMGCYASIPAIRMAKGFLATSFVEDSSSLVDIVHTEVCSLHTNPSYHQAEQLVIQSLFADGFIKYTVKTVDTKASGLKLLSVLEEVIPESTHSMTWNLADWGFEMSLSKDVPVRIARAIDGYLDRLFAKAKISREVRKKALFAIHPGGPKILQQICTLLDLNPEQIRYSEKVLYEYGNMSSATLPHIWEKILLDPQVEAGTPIVSLAFGPGLSICGTCMEKC